MRFDKKLRHWGKTTEVFLRRSVIFDKERNAKEIRVNKEIIIHI